MEAIEKLKKITVELKAGTLKDNSIQYLVEKRDFDDILGVIFSVIEEQETSGEKKRNIMLAKLVTKIIEHMIFSGNLVNDTSLQFKTIANFIGEFLRKLFLKNTDHGLKFVDNIIVMSESPTSPAAGFIVRIFVRFFTTWGLETSSSAKQRVVALRVFRAIAIALKTRENDLKTFIDDQRLRYGSKEKLGELMQIVLAYVKDEDATVDDQISEIYRKLWGRVTQTDFKDEYFFVQSKSDARAALFLISEIAYEEQFHKYVGKIMTFAKSPIKTVKSEACRSIGHLIIACPDLLSIPCVESMLDDCAVDAKALASMAKAIAMYLVKNPAADNRVRVSKYLLRLLQHSSMSVKEAAITAISHVLAKVPDFSNAVELSRDVLEKIDDPEEKVLLAACRFFSIVHGDGEGLVEVAVFSPRVVSLVAKILAQTEAGHKAVCLSQAPITTSDEEPLLLAQTIALKLQEATDNKSALAAAKILHAVAQTYPDAVGQQTTVLTQVLCQYLFGEIFTFVCRTLVLVKTALSSKETVQIIAHLERVIAVDEKFAMPTGQVTTLLSLLHVLHGEDNLSWRTKYLEPYLKILKTHNMDDENDGLKNIVKRALCFVIYLWKDFEENKEMRHLIRKFLLHPTYNTTVLLTLGDSRLVYVSPRSDPYFTKLINNYLSFPDIGNTTPIALRVIYCTIKGYNGQKQKPDMKNLGNSTSEVVSEFLQNTLPNILDCIKNKNLSVRKSAACCLELISQSGLIMPENIMPHMIAMTTDDDKGIQEVAKSMLKSAAEGGKGTISTVLFKGMHLAYEMARNVNPEQIARGYDALFMSHCAFAFSLVRNRTDTINRMLTQIMQIKDPKLVLYYLDQIMFFPYKAVGEVESVFEAMAGIASTTEDSLNSRLLKKAETHFAIMYKAALKLADKSKKKNETASRKDVNSDYLNSEVLTAISDGGVLLDVLQPEVDSEDEHAGERKEVNEKTPSSNDTPSTEKKKKKKGFNNKLPCEKSSTPVRIPMVQLNNKDSTAKRKSSSANHSPAKPSELKTPLRKRGKKDHEVETMVENAPIPLSLSDVEEPPKKRTRSVTPRGKPVLDVKKVKTTTPKRIARLVLVRCDHMVKTNGTSSLPPLSPGRRKQQVPKKKVRFSQILQSSDEEDNVPLCKIFKKTSQEPPIKRAKTGTERNEPGPFNLETSYDSESHSEELKNKIIPETDENEHSEVGSPKEALQNVLKLSPDTVMSQIMLELQENTPQPNSSSVFKQSPDTVMTQNRMEENAPDSNESAISCSSLFKKSPDTLLSLRLHGVKENAPGSQDLVGSPPQECAIPDPAVAEPSLSIFKESQDTLMSLRLQGAKENAPDTDDTVDRELGIPDQAVAESSRSLFKKSQDTLMSLRLQGAIENKLQRVEAVEENAIGPDGLDNSLSRGQGLSDEAGASPQRVFKQSPDTLMSQMLQGLEENIPEPNGMAESASQEDSVPNVTGQPENFMPQALQRADSQEHGLEPDELNSSFTVYRDRSSSLFSHDEAIDAMMVAKEPQISPDTELSQRMQGQSLCDPHEIEPIPPPSFRNSQLLEDPVPSAPSLPHFISSFKTSAAVTPTDYMLVDDALRGETQPGSNYNDSTVSSPPIASTLTRIKLEAHHLTGSQKPKFNFLMDRVNRQVPQPPCLTPPISPALWEKAMFTAGTSAYQKIHQENQTFPGTLNQNFHQDQMFAGSARQNIEREILATETSDISEPLTLDDVKREVMTPPEDTPIEQFNPPSTSNASFVYPLPLTILADQISYVSPPDRRPSVFDATQTLSGFRTFEDNFPGSIKLELDECRMTPMRSKSPVRIKVKGEP